MFYRLLSKLIEVLIVAGATILVTIVTCEVVLRYLFGHSLIFTDELSRYLMVWIVFLGSALAIRDEAHIRINILSRRLPHQFQRLMTVCSHGLTLIFLVILTVEGIKILPRQLYQMCVTFNASLFWFYLAIPVGCILMIIFQLPVIKSAICGKLNEAGQVEERKDTVW